MGRRREEESKLMRTQRTHIGIPKSHGKWVETERTFYSFPPHSGQAPVEQEYVLQNISASCLTLPSQCPLEWSKDMDLFPLQGTTGPQYDHLKGWGLNLQYCSHKQLEYTMGKEETGEEGGPSDCNSLHSCITHSLKWGTNLGLIILSNRDSLLQITIP